MNDLNGLKMGRRKNTGNIKIKLKDLVEAFKLDTEIPLAYTFARQFNLLPKEPVENGYTGKLYLIKRWLQNAI